MLKLIDLLQRWHWLHTWERWKPVQIAYVMKYIGALTEGYKDAQQRVCSRCGRIEQELL